MGLWEGALARDAVLAVEPMHRGLKPPCMFVLVYFLKVFNMTGEIMQGVGIGMVRSNTRGVSRAISKMRRRQLGSHRCIISCQSSGAAARRPPGDPKPVWEHGAPRRFANKPEQLLGHCS